jgi:hypothetical protein
MSSEGQNKHERWGGGRLQAEHLLNELYKLGFKYNFVYQVCAVPSLLTSIPYHQFLFIQPAMIYVHNLPEFEIEGISIFSKHPILETGHIR